MKLTKWLPTLAISSLMLSTVVGCSSGSEEQPAASLPPAVEDNSPVTIQYWHSHADVQMPAVNYMIAEFQKKYPNITVEPVFQGAYVDLHKKLQAAVAAKEVPAVTNVEVSVLPNFADGGVFADLTPYIARDKVDMNDFSKGMLQAYSYNNKQFGFPLIVSTSVMIYNKTMLDKLGVKPPQTWAEIEDFNKKVTVKDNGKTSRYAFSVPGWDTWYYDPWISNGGGTILSQDHKKSQLDQPDSLKWVQNFQKWMKDGSMHMGYGKGASDTMRQMFLEEKVAMVQHSSAIIKTYLENAKFEVGVSFLPGDKERKSHIGGAGIVMMDLAPAKQKEAAWKFIKFMTAAENNIKWAEGTGYLPTHKSVLTTDEGKKYFEKLPQYKAVFDNFDNVVGRPQHPAYPEFSKKYMEALGKMILENADPVQTMKEASKEIDAILQES
ncbi:ABC transporter substrate-binding protein [Paenibacillus sp. GCM10023248]|uniref:ABC transporter substrate-binding protein n=1 Tax=Bacillales TaxID=1385 RepID=UPI002378C28F|nr:MULTISPECIES: ABC transporter substrate-binding protein [Bacillales]MDD9270764.1 ABC transporter substrate-binding protein [Paenibacillus sp. MAHUQ-63]MDR6883322.1 multiple sugar transport system substrate-binding protein/sn-glycerol 3-phosphate transport system substrate-binding protein [Bacillus sp. 3255]